MRKTFKSLLTAALFTLVIAALTAFGTVKASAAEPISADLDGDGTDEIIEYEIREFEDQGCGLAFLTVNGESAIESLQLEENFVADRFSIDIFDSCTKDGVKELLISKGVEELDEIYLFRYKKGKFSKYCQVNADELVSQKKKNRIATKGYVFVHGIGNIRVTETFKVKSGRAVVIDTPLTPNKDNETTTFKTNRKVTLYSDEYVADQIGTLKKGAKFKLVKFVRDGEGNFTRVCVKSNGVTGWIDTTGFDFSTFIVKNPPLWE